MNLKPKYLTFHRLSLNNTLYLASTRLRYLGSCALSLAYCSAVIHVHWGSRALLGLAGVDKGLRFVFTFCLFGGSNLRLYDEDALRENLKDGDWKRPTKTNLPGNKSNYFPSCGKGTELTQHSLNCLASIGEVKFRPQVSLVIGSFQ